MKKITLYLTILAITLFFGCRLSSPELNNLSDSCKVFLQCLYLNQNNPDKTVCSKMADACGNTEIMKVCGGTDALKNNELQFLKCVTNLK
jgi:hypothetical protein